MAVTNGTGADTPPEGFTTFNGHHYKYVKGLFSYYEAQAGAAAQGGHLATITSAAENAFLAGLIAGQDLGAWLGGSDAADEGVWRWTEGPEAGTIFWTGLSGGGAPSGRYANWSVGEPNGIWNGLEEDHFHMMANSAKWNDASGQWATMGYFVEISGDVPPPPVNAPPAITSNGGGASAAISVAENTRAVTTVTASDPEGDALTFAVAGGADAALFSIDATSGALTFRNASDFEAPVGADNLYDVIIRASATGGQDTQALTVSITDVNENPTGGETPPGFTTFNGHHYKYVQGDFTHSQASAQARAEGGHLATIGSAAENAVLASLMATANAGGYGGWLGGGDAAQEGVWRWTEGPETGQVFWNGLSDGAAPPDQFTRWLPGEPSQYGGTEEDHLHMLAGTDQWNDIPNQFWLTMGYFVEISA
jgi:hypothetical protein